MTSWSLSSSGLITIQTKQLRCIKVHNYCCRAIQNRVIHIVKDAKTNGQFTCETTAPKHALRYDLLPKGPHLELLWITFIITWLSPLSWVQCRNNGQLIESDETVNIICCPCVPRIRSVKMKGATTMHNACIWLYSNFWVGNLGPVYTYAIKLYLCQSLGSGPMHKYVVMCWLSTHSPCAEA